MKISELVNKLNQAKSQFGDIEVYHEDAEYGPSLVEEIYCDTLSASSTNQHCVVIQSTGFGVPDDSVKL